MFLQELAKRIRGQREKRGLKQQDIANALRVSPQAVSKWERGENAPDVAILAPLAQVLGVTVDWLLEAPERPDVLEAAVLFSSVRGAYEKSLGMEARDFAAWANGLFFSLTETTLQHGGVPIKYMGDQYLCFFSGSGRRERALTVALRGRGVVTEDLTIGLSCGEIYLGAMGHPDYARPDIMGQVVNAAYLAMQWAEDNTESGIAATAGVAEGMEALAGLGAFTEVSFRDIAEPLRLCEVRAKQAAWNDNCN